MSISPKRQTTPSTESSVERYLLRVGDEMLDVPNTELTGAPSSHLDHLRGEVRRDEPAVVAQHGGRFEAGIPRAGGELEQGVAGLRIQRTEH